MESQVYMNRYTCTCLNFIVILFILQEMYVQCIEAVWSNIMKFMHATLITITINDFPVNNMIIEQ